MIMAITTITVTTMTHNNW